MSFDDRLTYLLIGAVLGFVVGYVVRSAREIHEIKEKVHEVEHVKHNHTRNDAGFMRYRVVADLAVITVVIFTVLASFVSQKASNEVTNTQDQLARVSHCNYVVFGAFLAAVDERNNAFKEALHSNVEVQRSWYDFVKYQLHLPPYPAADQRVAANKYADDLKNFIMLSEASEKKAADNPYPTKQELSNCVYNKE